MNYKFFFLFLVNQAREDVVLQVDPVEELADIDVNEINAAVFPRDGPAEQINEIFDNLDNEENENLDNTIPETESENEEHTLDSEQNEENSVANVPVVAESQKRARKRPNYLQDFVTGKRGKK
jgi:hypothetical protein